MLVRSAFKAAGDLVRDDAADRFRVSTESRATHERDAGTLRTVVRSRGVEVEQTKGRTTGGHPEYGRWQIHRLEDALEAEQVPVVEEIEHAIHVIADHFAR